MKNLFFALIFLMTAPNAANAVTTHQTFEVCSFSGIVDNGDGTATYNGATYTILTGPKGGKYIVVDGVKKYLTNKAPEKPQELTDNRARYKGKEYQVHTGPKGGRYIITDNGSKIYLPKKTTGTI